MADRVNGTVKFFNHSRGFGFIAPDNGGKDVFVHVTALERSGVANIDEGDKVTFEIVDDTRGRGKQAANIQLA
jgi:CspA family cold shock protein